MRTNQNQVNFNNLLKEIGFIHTAAKAAASRSVDRFLTLRNWLIGACIVKYEQQGEDRAAYGEELIPRLAQSLKESGHQGLGVSNLRNSRQVALCWPNLEIQALASVLGPPSIDKEIHQTLSGESEILPERWQGGFPSLLAYRKRCVGQKRRNYNA